MEKLPKFTDLYRPRADSALLSRLVQDAWQAESRKLTDQQQALGACEIVTAHLESRFPGAHMAILARYGVAKSVDSVGVRTYSPETKRWDSTTSVTLTRAVITPGAYGTAEVSACGPRWSRDPNRGLTEGYFQRHTHEEYLALIADQDRRESEQLPESVEPYFSAVVTMRARFQDEYRQAAAWPVNYKSETGAFPTWGAIAEWFPIVGAWLEGLR